MSWCCVFVVVCCRVLMCAVLMPCRLVMCVCIDSRVLCIVVCGMLLCVLVYVCLVVVVGAVVGSGWVELGYVFGWCGVICVGALLWSGCVCGDWCGLALLLVCGVVALVGSVVVIGFGVGVVRVVACVGCAAFAIAMCNSLLGVLVCCVR